MIILEEVPKIFTSTSTTMVGVLDLDKLLPRAALARPSKLTLVISVSTFERSDTARPVPELTSAVVVTR